MEIGIPREILNGECRVALTPEAVLTLVSRGQRVYVEKNAGTLSGFNDSEYRKAGAKILTHSKDLWNKSQFIVKVKEPQPSEFKYFKPGKIIFCYFHLAAHLEIAKALLRSGATAISGESIRTPNGYAPLLVPMSEIAGRMASLVGAYHLSAPLGGRGTLVTGVQGVDPAHFVIIGGGTVGTNAADVALSMGATVTILDKDKEKVSSLRKKYRKKISVHLASGPRLTQSLRSADVIVGAVLVPGARAPRVITRKQLKGFKQGSVLVDVSIDQGGIADTCRVTTHDHPTYIKEGVVHYCVSNMPGAYGRTSTESLSNGILPYALKLSIKGLIQSFMEDPSFALGLTIFKNKIVHPAVAQSLHLPFVDWKTLL